MVDAVDVSSFDIRGPYEKVAILEWFMHCFTIEMKGASQSAAIRRINKAESARSSRRACGSRDLCFRPGNSHLNTDSLLLQDESFSFRLFCSTTIYGSISSEQKEARVRHRSREGARDCNVMGFRISSNACSQHHQLLYNK